MSVCVIQLESIQMFLLSLNRYHGNKDLIMSFEFGDVVGKLIVAQ